MDLALFLAIFFGLALALLATVLAFVFVIRRLAAPPPKCPLCRGPWSAVETTSKVVGQKKCFGLVDRKSRSKMFHNAATDAVGLDAIAPTATTSWKERVPVIEVTTEVTHTCRTCQKQWVELKTHQVEDFSKP